MRKFPRSGSEVGHRSRVRRDRGQQMIVKRPLEVIGILGAGLALEQARREFEHVVRVATLGGRRRQFLVIVNGRAGFHAGLVEPFLERIPADHKRMPLRHQFPEILGGFQFVGVAAEIAAMRNADGLGDVRIGVQAGQPVFARGQRTDKPRTVEHPRRLEMFPVTRNRIELRQHIAHRAEFILRIAAAVGAKDFLDLLRLERREAASQNSRPSSPRPPAPACCRGNDARPAGRP